MKKEQQNPKVEMRKVKLTHAHTHKGEACLPGDEITVTVRQAQWLCDTLKHAVPA